MPRKPEPLNPFLAEIMDEMMDRLLEHNLFPLMDRMFATIHPPEMAKPKLKKIRVNTRDREFMNRLKRAEERTARLSQAQGRRVVTHYDTLQVSRLADHETIQAAWKSLCVRFHPDKNPGDGRAAERMVKINQAWEVLGDPRKRAAYDRTL